MSNEQPLSQTVIRLHEMTARIATVSFRTVSRLDPKKLERLRKHAQHTQDIVEFVADLSANRSEWSLFACYSETEHERLDGGVVEADMLDALAAILEEHSHEFPGWLRNRLALCFKGAKLGYRIRVRPSAIRTDAYRLDRPNEIAYEIGTTVTPEPVDLHSAVEQGRTTLH